MSGSYGRMVGAAIGVCLAAAPALAEGGAAEALAKIRSALSAGGDVADVRAHRSDAVVEMDGQVVGSTQTIAVRSPRAMREAMDLSGVRQVVTLIGDEAWVEDANGSVRVLTGDELTAALVAHSLLFHLYLDGSSPEMAVEATSDRVTLRPAAGGPERVLTLGADSLPAAFTQAMTGATVRTAFSDWRAVDGVLWPFVSTQSTGDPRFDMTIRMTSVEILDALPAGAIPLPRVGAATDFEFVDPAAAADIEFDLAGSLVLVPVEVNGTPGRFLLDTGAGASVLARAFAKELGLPQRGTMEARGAAGSEPASFVDVERMAVPGVELRDQTIVTVALEFVADAIGTPIHGILGYDFLSRFAVEIDYERRRLALFPSGAYEARAGAHRLPLRIEANVPRVDGRLDDEHSGSFVLDTGNNWPLLLHSPFVREHGLAEDGAGSLAISGVGGQESMQRSRVETLALGDAVFRDVRTLLATADGGATALDEAIGNVGGALFAESVLAFDYGAGALWIMTARSASAR